MRNRVPLPVAFAILAAACYLGWCIGVNAAGPMPVIARDVPEPERNYVQETLRILNQPKTVTVDRPRADDCGRWNGLAIATYTFYNARWPNCP